MTCNQLILLLRIYRGDVFNQPNEVGTHNEDLHILNRKSLITGTTQPGVDWDTTELGDTKISAILKLL